MWNQSVFSWCISYCEMQVYFPVKTGGFRGGRGGHSPISFSDQNIKKTHKLVVYYSKSVFVAIHPSYNKSRIARLIALKSYFLKTQNLEVSSGFAPWVPIRIFALDPLGAWRWPNISSVLGPLSTNSGSATVKTSLTYSQLVTAAVAYNSTHSKQCYIYTRFSLYRALYHLKCYIYKISSLYRALYHLKHCYIYNISSLYRALYHLKQCYM